MNFSFRQVALCLTLLFSFCGALQGGLVTGKVTDSATGKGLPGLLVSDGITLVKTDSGGEYRITVPDSPDGAKIFVHQPSDYRSAEFYKIVSPGENRADFRLRKVTPTQGVTFLQIADTETYHFGWIPAFLKIIEAEKPDFLLHSGDLLRIPGIIGHKKELREEVTGIPLYCSVGNHDLCRSDEKGNNYYRLWLPYWYSFEQGGILFIVAPIRKGDWMKVPFDLNQFYTWFGQLMSYFPKNQPKILLAHDLPQGGPAKIMLGKFNPLDYNCRCCFFGHWHENFVSRHEGGFTGYCVSPITKGEVDAQAAYRMVKVSPRGEISTRLVDVFAMPPLKKQPLSPELDQALWHAKFTSGSRFTAPKQQGKRIFFAEEDNAEAKKCAIVCVDGETGKLLWRRKTDFSVMGEMALNQENLYALDTAGNLYALNAVNGNILWKKKAPLGARAISSGLAYQNGVLYGNNETDVIAWNTKDGSPLWHTRAIAGSWSGVTTAPLLSDNMVISGRNWSGVMAMDRKTGKLLWHDGSSKDAAEKRMWYVGATPVLFEGKLYLKNKEAIAEIDLKTGKILRETEPANGFLSAGKVVVTKKMIFAGTRVYGVTAWKRDDFTKQAWSYTSSHSREVKSELLLWDEHLLIASFTDGTIHFLSPENGKALRPPLCVGSCAQLLKGPGDSLLILTLDGHFYRLPKAGAGGSLF